MDIQNLQYFLAIYDYRSFSKAAEVSHISQPALSRRIAALEAECGVQLIERGSHYMEFTPAGERFAANAAKIVARQEKIFQDCQFYKRIDGLRFGYMAGVNMRSLLKIQSVGRRFISETAVSYFDIEAQNIPNFLLAGDIDIAYVLRGEISDVSDVEFSCVERNNLTVIIPAGHKLWDKNFVSCDELQGETFLMVGSKQYQNATFAAAVEYVNNRIPSTDNIHYKKNPSELLVSICSGEGIGLNGIYSNDECVGSNEYYRNIIIADADVPYGDLGLAYKSCNVAAAEYVKTLSAFLKG